MDSGSENRSWWAKELERSRSFVTKMTRLPTAEYVAAFDKKLLAKQARADRVSSFQEHNAKGPRLEPRIADLYVDVVPGSRSTVRDAGSSVSEWLARDVTRFERTPALAAALQRSDIALKLSGDRPRYTRERDKEFIERSLDELLRIATGPYGGAAIGIERCVEIGLKQPGRFLTVIENHLFESAVGFRALRVLEQFATAWRSQRDHDEGEMDHTEGRLAKLLTKLSESSASFVDFYPGAEWSVTLAAERLGVRQDNRVAVAWLTKIVREEFRSDRERTYASWILSCTRPWEPESIRGSFTEGWDWLRRWDHVFSTHSWTELGEGGGLPMPDAAREKERQALEELIRETFARDLDVIHHAASSAAARAVPPSVRSGFESIIEAALINPDGRIRRNLIEATTAAGLSAPALEALTTVCNSVRVSPTVRETAAFLIGRLRIPDRQALTALLRLANEPPTPESQQTAVWAISDMFDPDALTELQQIESTLIDGLTFLPGVSTLSARRARVAAAHAAAVIGYQAPMFLQTSVAEFRYAASHGAGSTEALQILTWGEALAADPDGRTLIDPIALSSPPTQ